MPTVTRLRGAHSIRSDSTHPARLPGWPFLLTPNQPPPVRSHQGNPRASPEESHRHPEGKAAGLTDMGTHCKDKRSRRNTAGGGRGACGRERSQGSVDN